MISKSLYGTIILFVVFVTLTTIAAVYLTIEKELIVAAFIGGLLIFIESTALIKYLNQTNRKLAFFVDSVRNEDTAVKFPVKINNKPVKELYNALNKVNELIREIKVESQYNENLLKTLIEYSSTGFITIDEEGDFQVMNSAARKYLGVEYTSNLSRLKEIDSQLYYIITHLKPGETATYKTVFKYESAELSVSFSELKYYGKRYKLISLHDITKELEEQEFESWHKLFRVITHEIMNFIAPINSLSQTLSKIYLEEDSQKPCTTITDKNIKDTIKGLKVINEMSNGLMHFVDNYRELSKIPKPVIKQIDIIDWFTHLKTFILEIIKNKAIGLELKLENNLNHIYSDEKLLNQVIMNLVKNSIDAFNVENHSKNQKESNNKNDLEKKREYQIKIRGYTSEKGKLIIEVNDNGKGMSKEELEKVFVPFFTTKDHGNGIGLSISKQIIKALGGTMHVHSEEFKGTKVIISL